MDTTQLSIIIPVYNAENTLHFAIDSLKNQTFKNCELIFINDSSVDNSLNVILNCKDELEQQGFSVLVHSHLSNQGVAVARNSGLSLASGDYIYYLDSDDFLEPNTLELMLSTAQRESADIVGCSWFLSFKDKKRIMNQPVFKTAWEGIDLMLSGLMRWNLWLFMVKRSLYVENRIHFEPQMNMGEDLMVTLKLFAEAQKVHFIDKPLYHYNQMNDNSLTKNYSAKNMEEVTWNVLEAERYLRNSKYENRLGNLLQFLKLTIKLPLLISDKVSNYKKWLTWFPESNSYVSLNKKMSFRLYILQNMAVRSQYWFIKLHYYLVIKVMYGIIYK